MPAQRAARGARQGDVSILLAVAASVVTIAVIATLLLLLWSAAGSPILTDRPSHDKLAHVRYPIG